LDQRLERFGILAVFFVALFRPALFFIADFFDALFFAAVLRPALFFVALFFDAAFLLAAFFAGDFFAAVFFDAAFLRVAFFAVVRFTAGILTGIGAGGALIGAGSSFIPGMFMPGISMGSGRIDPPSSIGRSSSTLISLSVIRLTPFTLPAVHLTAILSLVVLHSRPIFKGFGQVRPHFLVVARYK